MIRFCIPEILSVSVNFSNFTHHKTVMAALARTLPRLNRYLPIARAYSSSTSSKYDGKDVDLVTHTGQVGKMCVIVD